MYHTEKWIFVSINFFLNVIFFIVLTSSHVKEFFACVYNSVLGVVFYRIVPLLVMILCD